MFRRLDTIPAFERTDGRTDGQTDTARQQRPRYTQRRAWVKWMRNKKAREAKTEQ